MSREYRDLLVKGDGLEEKARRRASPNTAGGTATATVRPRKTNLEFGQGLHKQGVKRRQEKLRQRTIAAGKLLLGRRIYL